MRTNRARIVRRRVLRKPRVMRLRRRVLAAKRRTGPLQRRRMAILGKRRNVPIRKRRRLVRGPDLKRQPPVVRKRHPQEGLATGVNLIGLNRRETGIGESCRSAARALQAADVPFGIINYPEPRGFSENDYTWTHREISEPRHKVNVFHMNADTLRDVHAFYGQPLFGNRYNIGYWHWELPEFAEEWCDSFQYVQEIWVPSTFILDSISRKSPVPVLRIPHSIEVAVPPGIGRATFGLPQDRFLFLSMFDARSILERKNPQAPILAFKMAFDQWDESVGLVVKVNHPFPLAIDTIRQTIGEHRNIYVITDTLGRLEANGLINAVDSFVSLHRSEGFGLLMAEAMYLGKPVIGTNWSGNTDFMNKMNACPVNYSFVNVGLDFGPIKPYQIWAEPNLPQAADYMQRLVRDPGWRQGIARKGQETIRTEYSPWAIGHMIRNRLEKQGLL